MKHSEILRATLFGVGSLLLMIVAMKFFSGFFPGLHAQLQGFVAAYGLWGVFAGVFVGSTIFPFPTDAFFVSTVSLSGEPLAVFGVSVAAAFIAGLLNFFIAKWFSKRFVEKLAGENAIGGAKKAMDSYGPFAILLFGIIPSSPVFDAMTFVAGLTGMDSKKFALYSLVSRTLHYGILAWLGASFVS
ncbi:MAG: VTT domain-containing protein [Candidatus Micrarchaeia archaeon]|jgi:membrane protein YqaA with SNARE-associated domain